MNTYIYGVFYLYLGTFDEKKGCFTESFARTFISINMSQFPEQLIESELFGHRKGAFTGAIDAHKGIFSR